MTREETVQSLVRFEKPLDTLRAGLRSFPWDWQGAPLVTLTRQHLLEVLARWQVGELSAADVEEWANLVEDREDIDHHPSVADAVFDLANPVLQGPLHEVGPALCERLKA